MASTGSLLTTLLHCEGILQVLSGTGEVFLCKVYSIPSCGYLLLQIKHQGVFFFGLPPCCSLPPSCLFRSYRINGFRSSFGSQGAIRVSRGAGHDEGRQQTGWQPPQPLLPCHIHRSCDCWIFDFWILNEAFTVSKLTLTNSIAASGTRPLGIPYVCPWTHPCSFYMTMTIFILVYDLFMNASYILSPSLQMQCHTTTNKCFNLLYLTT